MIRNIILAVAFVATSLTATAQQSMLQPLQKTQTTTSAQALQPKKVAADELMWGYSDSQTFSGLGTEATGTFGMAIKVPGSGYLKNGKITGILMPVIFTDMKNVKVFVCRSLAQSSTIASKEVTTTLAAGYNEVRFDTPVTIDGDLFIGYTFGVASVSTETAKYPLGVHFDDEVAGSLFLDTGKGFVDYSGSGNGVAAIKVLVAGINQNDYEVDAEYKRTVYTLPSTPQNITVDITSNGRQNVTDVDYVVNVNGTEYQGHKNLTIAGGFNKLATLDIDFQSPAGNEPYVAKVNITKVNGQPNASKRTLLVSCDNISRKAPHKVLVEEFTGTGCGFCPRGWVGMEAIKAQQSDIAVPIALHQYNSTDPMYVAENAYAILPVVGAPSAVINRDAAIDPYYGVGRSALGILDDVAKASAEITPVDATLQGKWNADQTKVDATLDLEFLGNSGLFSVEYVITADDLAGTASSWRQTNYYYDKNVKDIGDSEEMLQSFCKGGTNGKNQVFLTFNDVVIASSYKSGQNTATELPMDFVAGDKVQNTFTLSMPTKASLKNAIDYSKVYVNALIFDENGYCVNAIRSRVMTQEEIDGIADITIANPSINARGTYNLNGQRVSDTHRGIVIVNGKKVIK